MAILDFPIYLIANWKEIYTNIAGLGKTGNSIGGFTFQFSDGWWKFGQTTNLDIHDINASWSNGGYLHDYVPGENNMNEEWFGICAKAPSDVEHLYELYPRDAYYALKKIHQINLNEEDITLEDLENNFNKIVIGQSF